MRPGDLVRLKSGSPTMSVKRVHTQKIEDFDVAPIECVWMQLLPDGTYSDLALNYFHPACLEAVDGK